MKNDGLFWCNDIMVKIPIIKWFYEILRYKCYQWIVNIKQLDFCFEYLMWTNDGRYYTLITIMINDPWHGGHFWNRWMYFLINNQNIAYGSHLLSYITAKAVFKMFIFRQNQMCKKVKILRQNKSIVPHLIQLCWNHKAQVIQHIHVKQLVFCHSIFLHPDVIVMLL